MRKTNEIKVKEDVRIGNIILEKGDKIKILKEGLRGYAVAEVDGWDDDGTEEIYVYSEDGEYCDFVQIDRNGSYTGGGSCDLEDFDHLDFKSTQERDMPKDAVDNL